MVFSRKISEETRGLVKFLSIEKKYSIREIAKEMKISKLTVGRYLRITHRNLQAHCTKRSLLSSQNIPTDRNKQCSC